MCILAVLYFSINVRFLIFMISLTEFYYYLYFILF